MKTIRFIPYILLGIVLFSCSGGEEAYIPKPKGYHRIEFDQHVYQSFSSDQAVKKYPYDFELSKHAVIKPDTSFMSEPYWCEIYYPKHQASIDISYKYLANDDSLKGYTNTSNKLTFKHNIKATAIDEYNMVTKNGYSAVLYELEGEVPSQFQYFVTDSSRHFLRAALYFPYSTKNDSLAPVIEYVKEDMVEMLNTVSFE